jgi:hypothetical protein
MNQFVSINYLKWDESKHKIIFDQKEWNALIENIFLLLHQKAQKNT